jgi:diguanylate cyclase (GGDEF)-like protein
MNDEMLVYRDKYSMAHVILSSLLFLYVLIQIVSKKDIYGSIGLWPVAIILVMDYCIYFFKGYRNKILWYVIRVIELIMVSVGFLHSITSLSAIFLGLLLVTQILEIVMANEFTDIYSRTITLMITGCPAIIYMLIMLFVNPTDQSEFFGMICSIIAILTFTIVMIDLFSHVVISTDEKVYKLRRLSENMNQANEALRIQQEKVKRANEELGIQKIKLETAYNKINNVNAETTIQNLIMKYISSSLEITTLLNLITESIAEAIGLDICAILIQPEVAGNDKILYRIRTRLGEDTEQLLSRDISSGCMDKYMSADGTYTDNRVADQKYSFLYEGQVGSLLVVPLVKEKIVQGALICGKTQYEFFHDNIPFFETVVSQLMVAIHNAGLYSKMQQMAIRDSLTGIYNRGQLNRLMDQYSKEAKEKNLPLSVALLDIDHFKIINDTYGHLFGDIVIKAIANLAQELATKYNGIAARYGGEEFVLVLPNRNVRDCKEIVEELRLMVEQMELRCEDDVVTAKVSGGLSSYPETCQHITELLNRADGAMYYSKKKGRNQITIDNDEVQEAIKKDKVS